MTIETKSVGLAKVLSGEPEHQWERYYQLKRGDTYVEIGANWGRYGMIASRKGCDKIILIEPSPVNIATIQEIIYSGRLQNTILIKKAISNKKGRFQFCADGNPSAHRLATGSIDADIIYVDVDTLDNLLTELNIDKVNLLASDCEGQEVEMIKGCERYLNEKRISNVAIGAYHNPEYPSIIMSILKDKGFKGLKYEDGVVYGHLLVK